MDEKRIEFQKRFNGLMKSDNEKFCIYSRVEKCSNKPIAAHSIQKSKILESISDRGYVVGFYFNQGLDIKPIGIKQASTFPGFCNQHDTLIFSDIENQDFSYQDKQYFLFAYRALAFEYWKKIKAYNINRKITSRELNLAPLCLIQYQGLNLAMDDLDKDLKKFEKELTDSNPNYNILKSKPYVFLNTTLFACCNVFHLIYDYKKNKINNLMNITLSPKTLFLNIFPQNGNTYVIFSCFISDYASYAKFFQDLDEFSEEVRQKRISQILISYCENIFFNPTIWDKLKSNEKDRFFEEFFNTMEKIDETTIIKDPVFNIFEKFKV